MSESNYDGPLGPRLLAWWEGRYGRMYQFVQEDDYFALRSKDEGDDEWIYSGTWISHSDKYGCVDGGR